jgi:hypothetical protein
MNVRLACLSAAVFGAVSSLVAQGQLSATSSVRVSGPVAVGANFTVNGTPAAPFVLFADFFSGPRDVLGVPLALGLSPALFVLDASVLSVGGSYSLTVPIPALPILSGLVAWSQALFPSSAAPNGVFTASNGESTVLFAGASAIVERFDDPLQSGFVGSFDSAVRGRLSGRFSTRRVQPVDSGDLLETSLPLLVSPNAMPLSAPIQSPLNPRGCRGQFLFRAADLGADGTAEVLVRAWWRVFDGMLIAPDAFAGVSIRAAHSQIVPNYRVDSFSALPAFPSSGLGTVFALHESSPAVLVRTGPYVIDPVAAVLGLDAQGLGRYLDWGIGAGFVYNGVDSLLLDVRTEPSPGAIGQNGAQVYIAVQSSALPGSRCIAQPTAPIGTLDPNAVAVGVRDNAIHDMVFEFARVEASASSPFRPAGVGSPDYQPALLAVSTPGASFVEITYRGADDALGTNATPFSADIDVADGKPFLQYSIRLVADVATGAVPSIDTLVIPVF